jgi:Zn-dependent peptidase ImmA (M78 family)
MPRRPRLPTSVYSSQGPIPIQTIQHLVETEGAYGRWRMRERIIEIDAQSAPATQIHTLFHEMVHVALWDSGAHAVVTPEQEEILCDAIGQYFAAAVQAGFLKTVVPK